MGKEINGFKYIHYSELNPLDKSFYFTKVYSFLRMLVLEYPFFHQWYNKLFLLNNDLNNGREIIICQYNGEIAGVAILKRDSEECKICTLRVAKKYQRNGIGKKLVEFSMEWLENDKPFITVHKTKQKDFAQLFTYYNFKLEQKTWGYYSIFSTELAYNGILPKKSILLNKIEMVDIKKIILELMEFDCFDFNEVLNRCIEIWWQREKRLRYKLISE